MNVTAKHKKARIFRDFLIETDGVNMFKEEEKEHAILFRSMYPVREEDKKQFMFIIDDSIYVTMQSLIVSEVPEDKRAAMLEVINQIHFEYPTVKYVLTPTGQVMTSTIFHAHEGNFDAGTAVKCTIELFKVIASNHYGRFLAVLGE
ncbi:MAG: hypothetical protein RR448_06695 [Niameybacter sp.]|uniref:hypothetical protein n=1 Tax=Niameybacter sp. TaxID=2033640 RepID=UPI002FCA1610